MQSRSVSQTSIRRSICQSEEATKAENEGRNQDQKWENLLHAFSMHIGIYLDVSIFKQFQPHQKFFSQFCNEGKLMYDTQRFIRLTDRKPQTGSQTTSQSANNFYSPAPASHPKSSS